MFLTTTNATPYKEDDHLRNKLRAGPKKTDVAGAAVFHAKPSAQVKVRRSPICSLIKDLSVPPGKRDYSSDNPQPSSRPASETPTPASRPTTATRAGGR